MRKIIFLDIDGVLNSTGAWKFGECQDTVTADGLHYPRFCSWSREWLNQLITETDAKIVISSVWRLGGLEHVKEIWALEEMSGEIIGITPRLGQDSVRGSEIDKWLENQGFNYCFYDADIQQRYCETSDISNFAIIDDDCDMLYCQRNNFVNVLPSPRNLYGFGKTHYLEAKHILQQDFVTTNQIEKFVSNFNT